MSKFTDFRLLAVCQHVPRCLKANDSKKYKTATTLLAVSQNVKQCLKPNDSKKNRKTATTFVDKVPWLVEAKSAGVLLLIILALHVYVGHWSQSLRTQNH